MLIYKIQAILHKISVLMEFFEKSGCLRHCPIIKVKCKLSPMVNMSDNADYSLTIGFQSIRILISYFSLAQVLNKRPHAFPILS